MILVGGILGDSFWSIALTDSIGLVRRFIAPWREGRKHLGFMLAHFIMRWAESDTMDGIIRSFAQRRPPGIYKDEYINELLQYYHEPRCQGLATPTVPEWKGIEDEEREDGQATSHRTSTCFSVYSFSDLFLKEGRLLWWLG